ncbi:MAG: hypothetical protein KAK00_07650 [Nanoarchaeota archaeon]|nr:hypothetical protein [Nanoarchaeota archaeon]
MTITWGKTKEVKFNGPYPIKDWDPPNRAAVYTIMKGADKEGYYSILYFGESENLSERGFYKSHHAYPCWINKAGSDSNLFIGIYLMPNSTREERREVEQSLISDYNPDCNKED